MFKFNDTGVRLLRIIAVICYILAPIIFVIGIFAARDTDHYHFEFIWAIFFSYSIVDVILALAAGATFQALATIAEAAHIYIYQNYTPAEETDDTLPDYLDD